MDSNLISSVLTAFILGLSASTHCIVMCGGIATALSSQNSIQKQGAQWRLICFHLGRIACYGSIGLIIGILIELILDSGTAVLDEKQQAYTLFSSGLRLFASILLILTALYLLGKSQSIKRFEQSFTFIWKKVSPITQRYMAMNTATDALKLGFLWGFLPCGMIYTALTWSLSQQTSGVAGLLMLAFGLGTAPSLLLLQSFHLQISRYLNSRLSKQIMAAALFIMAIAAAIPAVQDLQSLYSGTQSSVHSHHH